MKLTSADILFWECKKHPLPKWAEKIKGVRVCPSIDSVINGHVLKEERVNTQTHNAVALLQRVMRRKTFTEYMESEYLAGRRGCRWDMMQSPRRYSLYVKWFRRVKASSPLLLLTKKENLHAYDRHTA